MQTKSKKEQVLVVKSLDFGYDKTVLLYRDFNLILHRGELISLVGSSGIGKSTLFELISGNLKPLKGNISCGKIAWIFQDPYSSFHPTYSIIGQISDVASIENIASKALQMGLSVELLHKLPHELSGGQLQRCSILRALMMQPDIILCDEPTSALDNIIQLDVMKILLQHLPNIGILLITHDLELAKWASDQIIEIGKLYA